MFLATFVKPIAYLRCTCIKPNKELRPHHVQRIPPKVQGARLKPQKMTRLSCSLPWHTSAYKAHLQEPDNLVIFHRNESSSSHDMVPYGLTIKRT